MSKSKKRARLPTKRGGGPMKTSRAEEVAVPLIREGGAIGFSMARTGVPRPGYVMPCDAARAILWNGQPELQFASFHPLNPGRIVRLLRVRYETEQFKQRVEQNRDFQEEVAGWLVDRGLRGTPGEISACFDEAHQENDQVVSVDAIAEYMARVDQRAGILFLSTHSMEHVAAVRGASEITLTAPVEVTMPTRALVDLLESWKDVAEELPRLEKP